MDITQIRKVEEKQKRVEEALRESEEKYRSIFNNAQVGIFRTRISDGKVLECNDRFARTYGYETPEECIDDFVMSERYTDPGIRKKMVASLMEKGEVNDIEACFSRKDGDEVWIRFSARAYPEDGYLEGVGYDITEEKKTLEALRKSEAQKRAILDSSLDRIRLVDRDLRIIWANKTTTRELDITSEALVGKICYELFAERDTPCPGCPMIKALKSGKIEHAVLHQKKSKGIPGESYWDSYAVPIKDDSGHIVNLIEISRNITESKKRQEEKGGLEAQLRRSQKMEAIGTLAGGIAHDFNNILTGILGYGQLAQMKLDPESEVHTDLKEVLQSANRAKSLIQQILAVGRSQEQERQAMQLKYIVKEAIKFLKSTLPSTIEIQEKWDQDIGIIDADPTQMHQVVMNLCTNAGYAMEKDGGILEVSLQNEELRMKNEELGLEPGPYLKLTVSDTGYGIAPEIREKIFDPYFTTKERGEGTGIGLSVVHGIVAQHGGDITVESEPGKGSAFHIYLPLTQAEEDQPQVKEETPLPKGTERVLFIDDEATLARMGKEMLSGLGYDVTAMTDSLEALALFKEDPKQFDLVITDTTMPHMPGDILAQEMMRSEEHTSELQVTQ